MDFFETNRKTHRELDVNDAVRKNPKTWEKNQKKTQKNDVLKKDDLLGIFFYEK